jgi:hypothetical protein
MSWAKLLGDKRVAALPSSKAELDNLRSIVTRSLQDAAAANLSADAQFVMAYDAARTLSLMIVPTRRGCSQPRNALRSTARSGSRSDIRLWGEKMVPAWPCLLLELVVSCKWQG